MNCFICLLFNNSNSHDFADVPAADVGNETGTASLLFDVDAVPNLFQLMPHLENDVRALRPHRTVGHARRNGKLIPPPPYPHPPISIRSTTLPAV